MKCFICDDLNISHGSVPLYNPNMSCIPGLKRELVSNVQFPRGPYDRNTR